MLNKLRSKLGSQLFKLASLVSPNKPVKKTKKAKK